MKLRYNSSCARLARYVRILEEAGIPLPETEGVLVSMAKYVRRVEPGDPYRDNRIATLKDAIDGWLGQRVRYKPSRRYPQPGEPGTAIHLRPNMQMAPPIEIFFRADSGRVSGWIWIGFLEKLSCDAAGCAPESGDIPREEHSSPSSSAHGCGLK